MEKHQKQGGGEERAEKAEETGRRKRCGVGVEGKQIGQEGKKTEGKITIRVHEKQHATQEGKISK